MFLAIAEGRNGEVHGRNRAVIPWLGLGELQGPARITILMAQLRWLVLPMLGDTPGLEVGLFGIGVALAGSRHERGTTI